MKKFLPGFGLVLGGFILGAALAGFVGYEKYRQFRLERLSDDAFDLQALVIYADAIRAAPSHQSDAVLHDIESRQLPSMVKPLHDFIPHDPKAQGALWMIKDYFQRNSLPFPAKISGILAAVLPAPVDHWLALQFPLPAYDYLPNRAAPDLLLTTLDGRSVRLSSLRGKIVVINFFSMGCPPCMAEFPRLAADVWQKFSGPDFAMFAVDPIDSADAVQAFQAKYSWPFPLVSDPSHTFHTEFARVTEPSSALGYYEGIPQTYLIDRNGVIIGSLLGFSAKDSMDFDLFVQQITQEIVQHPNR